MTVAAGGMPNDSDQTSEPTPPRRAGPPGMVRRIPLSVRMLFYGAFFLSIVLVGLPWLAYRLDVYVPALHVELGGFRYVGAAFAAVCLALYVWNAYVLTSRGRGAFVEFDAPTEFVSTGPYRWVRNPVAASLIGTGLGLAVALSSTGVLVYVLLGSLLGHFQVVYVEEPLLRERFGQAYVDYLARVPRWIPRRPGEEGT